jgi:hypothetical protein
MIFVLQLLRIDRSGDFFFRNKKRWKIFRRALTFAAISYHFPYRMK